MKIRFSQILASVFALVGVSDAAERINPREALELFEKGDAVIVDVREKGELSEGKVKGSRWHPFSSIQNEDAAWKEFTTRLPKNKKIIFYCRAGGRAGAAADKLSKLGFKTMNMGGFTDWTAQKLPTEKP